MCLHNGAPRPHEAVLASVVPLQPLEGIIRVHCADLCCCTELMPDMVSEVHALHTNLNMKRPGP